jgi:hypothetical protein
MINSELQVTNDRATHKRSPFYVYVLKAANSPAAAEAADSYAAIVAEKVDPAFVLGCLSTRKSNFRY